VYSLTFRVRVMLPQQRNPRSYAPFIFMCIFVRISVYFVCLGLVIGMVFYSAPCMYFILFFCVLGVHNIDFICSTCIVSGQSALMHFNK